MQEGAPAARERLLLSGTSHGLHPAVWRSPSAYPESPGPAGPVPAPTVTPIRAITLDLDDTLWPIWPTIARAEQALLAWLHRHAPATAARHDTRSLREEVAQACPQWAHDPGAIRRESIRRALLAAGDDPGLSAAAFEVFQSQRQHVELFDDVRPALAALSQRLPLVALTNGNADLRRIGLAGYFVGTVDAPSFGVGKPDPRIFHAACSLAGAEPAAVLHVGDDWHLDVRGALDAGLQAAWLRREGVAQVAAAPAEDAYAAPHIPDLQALLRMLAAE